ncbi:hypothetical protein [Aquimarina muelleri]|uniref:Outer membrane protein beta-barrel domain-containing protein n=1 Tax=Aquimarina muelleri TaxID=279356 RepID=A0A918JYM4_9FLAO|nr:hypothetical protein [Aquimarina muelleri]MCX2763360.1 hypothetical protein [Aquimarina muelleri]GGX28503.1 hypothetical protein GCM10007384_32130 [Aquimarina muelleri]
MKHLKIVFLFSLIISFFYSNAQDSKDYIEFNDRNNIVHGVYLGFNGGYGKIEDKDTYIIGLKIAYVANRQVEIGFVTKAFYSNQRIPGTFSSNIADLGAVYSGLHLEPIFFSKAKFNLSFPLLVGGGAAGYINTDWNEGEIERSQEEDWDAIFVVEPGINILYNISRYVQVEAGLQYRFSSKIELVPNAINRINGISVGFGLKLGVFNLGRNRYKKSIPNHE